MRKILGAVCLLAWCASAYAFAPGGSSGGITQTNSPLTATQTGAGEAIQFYNVNSIINVLNYGTLGSFASTTVSGTVNAGLTAFPLASATNFTTNRWVSIAGAGPACGQNWNDSPWQGGTPYTCAQIATMTLATLSGAAPNWVTAHSYALNSIIQPVSNNTNAALLVVTACTNGCPQNSSSQPNVNASCSTLGSTCTDGNLTWTNAGPSAGSSWDYQVSEWDGAGGLGPDKAAVVNIATGPEYVGVGTAIIQATITYPANSVPGAVLWRSPGTLNQWTPVAFCGHQKCQDEGAVRTITDGVTAGTTTFTTTGSSSFTSLDVGKPITCVDSSNVTQDIPAGTTISAVGNPNSITLSQAATGSHSGMTCHIDAINDLAIPQSPPASAQADNLRSRIVSVAGNTINTADASSQTVTGANAWTDDAGMIQKAYYDAESVTKGPSFGDVKVIMPCLQATQTPSGNVCSYRMGSAVVTGQSAQHVILSCEGGGAFDGRTNGPSLWVGGSLTANDAVQTLQFNDCEVHGASATSTTYPLQDGVWVFGHQGLWFNRFKINTLPHSAFVVDKPGTSGGFATKLHIDVRARSLGFHGFLIGQGHALDDLQCLHCFESSAGLLVNGGSNVSLGANTWSAGNFYGFIEEIGAGGGFGYFVHGLFNNINGGTVQLHDEHAGNLNGGQAVRLLNTVALDITGTDIVQTGAAGISNATDGLFFAGANNSHIVVDGLVCDGDAQHVLTNCVNLNTAAGYPDVRGVTGTVGFLPTKLIANPSTSQPPTVPYKDTVTLSSGSGTLTDTHIVATDVCSCRDATTFANSCTLAAPGAGSIAVTGTGSDVIVVSCQ